MESTCKQALQLASIHTPLHGSVSAFSRTHSTIVHKQSVHELHTTVVQYRCPAGWQTVLIKQLAFFSTLFVLVRTGLELSDVLLLKQQSSEANKGRTTMGANGYRRSEVLARLSAIAFAMTLVSISGGELCVCEMCDRWNSCPRKTGLSQY